MVVVRRHRTTIENVVPLTNHSLAGLAELLSSHRVDTLICGGISQESKEYLRSRDLEILENIACTIDEMLPALQKGELHSGFGLSIPDSPAEDTDGASPEPVVEEANAIDTVPPDCLACTDRVCFQGKPCALMRNDSKPPLDRESVCMLEAGLDISLERERTLCRLSELIYFCLEMRYRRIGIAYCADLEEPATILTRVLRRFFDVFAVSCKVGGVTVSDPMGANDDGVGQARPLRISCNPQGQAEVLNRLKTDLNVIVGVCMGADCVFTRASDAPVTTLFVKDRSLANNPIGAVYSDYYLKEAMQASTAHS